MKSSCQKFLFIENPLSKDNDDELSLRNSWPINGVKPNLQPGPLSEILIANLPHGTSRVWTYAEPASGFFEWSCGFMITATPQHDIGSQLCSRHWIQAFQRFSWHFWSLRFFEKSRGIQFLVTIYNLGLYILKRVEKSIKSSRTGQEKFDIYNCVVFNRYCHRLIYGRETEHWFMSPL